MSRALAAQKADYLFGGGLVFIAFSCQLGSFFAPSVPFLTEEHARVVLGGAFVGTILIFWLLCLVARCRAKHYEAQISVWLKQKTEQ